MRLSRTILAVALSVPLMGCASMLFGKSEPAQLYRFGAEPAAASTVSGSRFGVFKGATSFVEAAQSDRLLTVTGGEAAYIKDARWVSPAEVLFEEALARKFQGGAGRARLIQRGEVAKADYVLKLDVPTFEIRYAAEGAIPQVVVEVRALLSSNQDRSIVGERVFTSTVTAADNRVGAIVPAYDQAVNEVLDELYAWVNSSGG
jgi:cholesterol transport system auxiliary component